ncbi:hypothetical protein K9N08_00775 [Candidatus Gracilibacteria bacterium]|nr:hypothetical protein [Candidatus Gracilibacteria bacterium]MCF7856077.1 hypothetical protein [Candidatus Gracilibacteria bacterium]MCF7896496.1 hypothetical protein [Candidatus Gracilibacteria bacterium]
MVKIKTTKELIKFLEDSKSQFQNLGKEMMEADGGKMFPMDLFAMGIINRSLLLVTGFCTLIRSDNFLSAAPIIRLYLDTLLQFYACFIVEDPHGFSMKKLEGKQTNTLKDKDGNKMTDGHLASQISKEKEFEWVKNVYKETSKFIHFSDKHIFSACTKIEGGGAVEFCLSEKMKVSDSAEREAVVVMIETTKGIFKYLCGWTHTKNNPHCIGKNK